MAPTENAALVEDAIRGYPSRELVRSRAKIWNDADMEYAYSRIDELTHSSCRANLIKWLDELRNERAEERRHREALGSNFTAIKISRVALWVSIAAAFVSLAAWLFPRH